MIVFINGAFGVGKTSVATKLAEAVPDSLLYDPEEVGFMLRNILKPHHWTGDFQDYPMWRTLTVDVARQLKESYGRTLIVPMTIWHEGYFTEVMSGLKGVDANIHHFCLMAPADCIRKRIFQRGEQQQGDWIFEQLEKCMVAFKSSMFEEKIDSTALTVEQIAQHVLAKLS